MSSPGDGRSKLLTNEDVQPLRLKERTAQVSCLPFSVNALMSDMRRANRADREKKNNVFNDDPGHRPDELTEGDSASWISNPVMMPISPREFSGILFELLVKICLLVNSRYIFTISNHPGKMFLEKFEGEKHVTLLNPYIDNFQCKGIHNKLFYKTVIYTNFKAKKHFLFSLFSFLSLFSFIII